VVLDPLQILPEYQLAPLNGILKELGAASPQDLLILVILNIPPERPRQITANLMAPLVLNRQTRQGRQLIIDNPNYGLKYRVFPLDRTLRISGKREEVRRGKKAGSMLSRIIDGRVCQEVEEN
jgi:flagellar assembly factor FliW